MTTLPEDDSYSFIVSSQTPCERLDKLLPLLYPEHSRTYFQWLIAQGAVLVNGKPVKKRIVAQEGDEIECYLIATPELNLTAQPIPLDILYEDEHILAVNKPPGMVVHPAPGHPDKTFVNALLFHCQGLTHSDPLRPGIVHRLDKDTSGVMLAAKSLEAHAKLVELFSSRKIQKQYLALCVGTPPEGLIDLPIGRHPIERKKMAVNTSHGRCAQTVVTVLCHTPQLALLSIELLTGRTHQIRVHLSHLKHPVLGDPLYGSVQANQKFHTTRQLLHAHTLRFNHPFSLTPIEIKAPPPDDLMHYCSKYLGSTPVLSSLSP